GSARPASYTWLAGQCLRASTKHPLEMWKSRRARRIARISGGNCNLWRLVVLVSADRLKSCHRMADIEPRDLKDRRAGEVIRRWHVLSDPKGPLCGALFRSPGLSGRGFT